MTKLRGARQSESNMFWVLVYGCILMSGAAGLVYEVVWARQIELLLIGITTYAHTAVITAFMIGLAAGSLVLGRVADRHGAPLRVYGWLEIGIGVYAVATPWLFPGLQTLYSQVAASWGITATAGHLLRFTLALVALLIPTFMMGGTLPLFVRGLTRNLDGLATSTARLYGLNTLGATVGAFTAGYLLLPAVGVRNTIFVAAVLSIGAGLGVFLANRIRESAQSTGGSTKQGRDRLAPTLPGDVQGRALSVMAGRLLLAGFALSGFASLVYQVAWVKALTLVVGSSVYAFSITLTTFLAGIAVGSLIYSRYAAGRTTATSVRLAAWLQFGICISSLVGLVLIGHLPEWFLRGHVAGMTSDFALLQAFIFLLSFAIMIWPTLMLGAVFPLVTSLWTRDSTSIGRGVGTAYAANAAGTILGALVGGLLLLPILGVQKSVVVAAGLNMLVASLYWLLGPQEVTRRRVMSAMLFPAAFLIAVALIPEWDRSIVQSGVFFNADRLVNWHDGPAGA